ncbi:hypothetical protein ACKVMT_08560 [Halobacteriales archaeon Cl-PHB]
MELSGKYDSIVDKLARYEGEREDLRPLTADFERLIDTIDALDGGTKSVILENLPAEMAVTYDSDSVVSALHVLQHYDLVTLDGNTWKVAD